jgi:hypothetical protein
VAIKIEFLSDVKDVVRGADTIADKLQDVAGDLQDMAKAGDRSSDKLTDSFKDVSKGLDGAGDDAKTFQERAAHAFKAVADKAEKSGKDVGTSQKQGLEKAGQGLDDFKSEANGTARETAASFDGSADSIAGSFQEVAANAFAGFGPAGAAAGLAVAAGLGIAQAMLQGNADKANELGERVTELAGKIREAGGDLGQVDFRAEMEEWGLGIQDTKEWWELFQDSAKTGLDTIKEKAGAAGVSWVDAFKGTKGTMDDSRTALEQVDKALQAAKDSAVTYVNAIDGSTVTDEGDQKKIKALEELKKGYEENITTQQDAAEQSRLLDAAGIKTTAQIEAEKDALDDANDALATHASKLAEAAGAALNADEAELQWSDTLKQSKADIEVNGKSTDINTEAGKANRQTLIDMAKSAADLEAAQIAQGGSTADVTKKTQAARQSFVDAATAAGYTKTQAEALATKYGLVPKNVDTKVKAHGVEEARKWPDTIPNSKDVSVNVNVGQDHVTRYIDGMDGRPVYVNVKPRPGGAWSITD